jgi:hypothetical protein
MSRRGFARRFGEVTVSANEHYFARTFDAALTGGVLAALHTQVGKFFEILHWKDLV